MKRITRTLRRFLPRGTVTNVAEGGIYCQCFFSLSFFFTRFGTMNDQLQGSVFFQRKDLFPFICLCKVSLFLSLRSSESKNGYEYAEKEKKRSVTTSNQERTFV